MVETWLPAPGYEGSYEVSDQGQVKSLERFVLSRWGTPKPQRGRVLRQSVQGQYKVVTLYRDQKPKMFLVHRLVLLTFVGPCPDGQEGLHFDDDADNNRLENLRWGTRIENSQDCIRNGKHPKVNVIRCPQGHDYDAENTFIDTLGYRSCRTCRRFRNREAKRRRKAARAV